MTDDWDENIVSQVAMEIWENMSQIEKDEATSSSRSLTYYGRDWRKEENFANFLRIIRHLPEDKVQEAIEQVKRRTKLKAFK